MQVIAHQGDTIESICWRYLKTTSNTVKVMEMNPHLAIFGAVLPEGSLVTIPDSAPATPEKKLTQLWD